MQHHYKISFKGEILAGFDANDVKRKTQTVFKLTDQNLQDLFNGSSHTLKNNLSLNDCEKYIEQLQNLGLIVYAEPPIPSSAPTNETPTLSDTPPVTTAIEKPIAETPAVEVPVVETTVAEATVEPVIQVATVKTKKSKTSTVILLILIIVAGGGAYLWNFGYIDEFLEPKAPPEQTYIIKKPAIKKEETVEIAQTNAPTPEPAVIPEPKVIEEEPPVIIKKSITNAPPEPLAIDNTIELCTDPKVTHLLEKILAEGLPQLIQRSSPEINLTLNNYSNNQELYYDSGRNKRLCGVLGQYKVESPRISPDITDPTVVYEVLFELQKEADQNIRLNTIKQQLISSNIQETDEQVETDIQPN